MDMESIEALNLALEAYEGTLLFVSHDRQFVSSLATVFGKSKTATLSTLKVHTQST